MKNIGRIDGVTRAVGGILLLLGALLVLPGIDARTSETLFLWGALLTGMSALLLSVLGNCAWYSGIFITLSAVLLLFVRVLPFPAAHVLAALSGVVVASLALFTRAVGHCPVNASLFRVHSV